MPQVRRLAVLAALVALSGCAAAGASLDRMADQVEARSNCHTSTGEFVRMPSCTITWSGSNTTTTTTSTTTTAPVSSPTPASRSPDDQA